MKHYREYKIKYFERFGVQDTFFKATLDESFFREWYDKLSAKSEENWHQKASTSIRLLLAHKDAPDWLRDLYANHSRYDRRHVALLSSPIYKYKNIEKILMDRSSTIKLIFFHSVLYDLQHGLEIKPEHILRLITTPIILPSLRNLLRITIQEEVAALIHPDSIVRTLAKIFYNATPMHKQLLIDSIK